ncbi:fucose 4-O-acetylase-like acetyltransferase [Sphaerotilus hippei]|uniref:Fucose 4-O-acetylase-like acetyltransferase n=1 Tax=Sphaerotilus hippei TaxID=744406 RepID=A0A318H0V7_9BURK|nr:acyltransferase family protein [Sphaerotilus hippei]PXW94965.1 fucose 4-O-acetylase-like acetyltransferase [Sphaerotilus hippei]
MLVVLGHAVDGSRLHDLIYSFHMPLFFFAAGCVFPGERSGAGFRALFRQRIQVHVRYYVWFSLIGIAYFMLVKHLGPDRRALDELLVNRSISLLTASASFSWPGLAPEVTVWPVALWFFPALVWCLSAWALVLRCRVPVLAGMALGVWSIGWWVLEAGGLPWSLDAAALAFPFVVVGGIFQRGALLVPPPSQAVRAVALAVLCSGLALIWHLSAALLPFTPRALELLRLFGFAAVVMPLAVLLAGMRWAPWSARIVHTLSRSALLVFPFHIIVFSIVDNLVRRLHGLEHGLAYGEPAGVVLRVGVSFLVLVPAHALWFGRRAARCAPAA